MKLGENTVQKVDVIPTGSLSVDAALGVGGFPRGRIVEIYGPESSGKTTLALHCVAQAQIQGYILNIQGWGSETLPMLRLHLTLLPMLLLNYAYTGMIYTAIERTKLKQRELVLLECRCFIAHETGAEKIARQAHYLEGINNGITYHFQLTKRTYHMLKKEKTLKLQIHTGLFGGIYIIELDNPDFFKRVRRMDRKAAKIGMVLGLLAAIGGVAVFWFL